MKSKTETKTVFISADQVCDRRKVDARKIYYYFIGNGYLIVTNPRKADVIFLLTCGGTNQLAEKSFNNLKRYDKLKGELIVSGCIPETDTERLNEVFDGKIIKLNELDLIDKYFPSNDVKFKDINDQNNPWINIDESKLADLLKNYIIKTPIGKRIFVGLADYIVRKILTDNHLIGHNFLNLPVKDYYVVRISWGCLGNCSYCATKKAVGTHHSKPFDKVIKEFKKGVESGYKNFFITGDDTGAYGTDIDTSIVELLKEITKIKGDYNITFQAFHPQWIVKYVDELSELLKSDKIKAISIPIQSGNQKILRSMRRYSEVKKIKEAIIKLKKLYPDLFLDTHIIVGFPGETFDNFKDTLRFISELGFDFGALIPLSLRPGTEVEKINPKVPASEIERRLIYGRKYLDKKNYRTIKGDGVIFSKRT